MSVEEIERSYEKPGVVGDVFAVLCATWPWFASQERAAREQGLRWEAVSSPFLLRVDGRPLAHVGVLEIPLVLAGKEVTAGGIHAVATHPDFRRRGYFRKLMQEALAWCDERYETLLLSADTPAIYEPFGFRVIEEHRFKTAAPAVPPADRTTAREFFRTRVGNVAVMHRLLEERAPLSDRLAVRRETSVFVFNTARGSLVYSDELNALVSCRLEGATLRLFDVVAPELPTLERLVAVLPGPAAEVEAYFNPDALGGEWTPEPHLIDGDDYLLVRGPFLPEGEPAMLAPPARC